MLWKLLRLASADLYLFFQGAHPLSPYPSPFLDKLFTLKLLSRQPDASTWALLDARVLKVDLEYTGSKPLETLLASLSAISTRCTPLSPALCLEIRDVAAHLLSLERGQEHRRAIIEDLADSRPELKALLEVRGFGPFIAGTLAAEIIDIRRFPSNDHLASYAGLGRSQYGTGQGRKEEREVKRRNFNTRLKNCFFTAAMQYCLNNPDSHLAGYQRNLVKAGMKKTESYKRVEHERLCGWCTRH